MKKETYTLTTTQHFPRTCRAITTIREVDPYEGMSTGDFDQIAHRHFGYDFWINENGDVASDREHDTALAYYFNQWNDTLKFCRKVNSKANFELFMGAMVSGEIS
jgi:hypothetical protein